MKGLVFFSASHKSLSDSIVTFNRERLAAERKNSKNMAGGFRSFLPALSTRFLGKENKSLSNSVVVKSNSVKQTFSDFHKRRACALRS